MRILSQIIKITLSILAVTIAATAALAHGDPTAGQDICERGEDPAKVHFNAYQFKPDPRMNFCNDIPKTGETTIVIDLVTKTLRNKPIAVKIYAVDEGGKKTSIFERQPKIYPQGMIETSVDFKKTGKYVAEVLIEGNEAAPPTLEYNIGAGMGLPFHMPRSMMVVILVAVLAFAGLAYSQITNTIKKQS